MSSRLLNALATTLFSNPPETEDDFLCAGITTSASSAASISRAGDAVLTAVNSGLLRPVVLRGDFVAITAWLENCTWRIVLGWVRSSSDALVSCLMGDDGSARVVVENNGLRGGKERRRDAGSGSGFTALGWVGGVFCSKSDQSEDSVTSCPGASALGRSSTEVVVVSSVVAVRNVLSPWVVSSVLRQGASHRLAKEKTHPPQAQAYT